MSIKHAEHYIHGKGSNPGAGIGVGWRVAGCGINHDS